MNVPRWLKGNVWASPHRRYVRVQIEMYPGLAGFVPGDVSVRALEKEWARAIEERLGR